MHGACVARKPISFARVTRLRNSTCPAASAPCTWNTCFAMSNPIVLACSTDASFSDGSTPSPWHADAVGGRPPHHPTAIDLVGTLEVPLEHQLATACDQDGVHIGARSREPISHPAQRIAVDELILIDGGDGPAVFSRDWNTAAAGRVGVRRQRRERCQRSSTEK